MYEHSKIKMYIFTNYFREMLEEQLQRWRKRSEHVMSLESEIIKYKQKLNDMALERDSDRSKLEELIEENTQLQLVTKTLNSTLDVDKSFSDNDDDCNSGDNSLSEQLTNNAQVCIIKLFPTIYCLLCKL